MSKQDREGTVPPILPEISYPITYLR